MSEKTLSTEFLPAPPEPVEASPRERTRRRLVGLTRVAVMAALPLTATACDPAPMIDTSLNLETCHADTQLYGEGVGVEQEGVPGLQVSLQTWQGVLSGDAPDVQGATGDLIRDTGGRSMSGFLVPNEGATEVTLRFAVVCGDGQVVQHVGHLDLSAGWPEGMVLEMVFE